jgi:hypothetical protein
MEIELLKEEALEEVVGGAPSEMGLRGNARACEVLSLKEENRGRIRAKMNVCEDGVT